jgi:hypothetical protein
MSNETDFDEVLRSLFAREEDRLIDQGIPPQPEDEAYVDLLAQGMQERAIPELEKRKDWLSHVFKYLLTHESSTRLLEWAWQALEAGENELAGILERMAARRQLEEWILEETKAIERAVGPHGPIAHKAVIQNVRAKHPDEVDELGDEQLNPIVLEVLEKYFGPPSERWGWMDRI